MAFSIVFAFASQTVSPNAGHPIQGEFRQTVDRVVEEVMAELELRRTPEYQRVAALSDEEFEAEFYASLQAEIARQDAARCLPSALAH